jgi:phage tail-like protein
VKTIRIALIVFVFCVGVLGSGPVTVAAAGEQREPSYYFTVRAGDESHDLGTWSKVSGLDVTWDLAEYRSGGAANVSRWYFPGNTKYQTVTLHRASSDEIDLVLAWLRDLAATGEPQTLVITLFDSKGEAVVSWQLEGVLPKKYTAGSFNAEGTDVEIETLVLSHEGFIVTCARGC